MPKILVLFHSSAGTTAMLANAVAEGARSVRFAEVDVRRVDGVATTFAPARTLGAPHDLAGYDAIVVGSPGPDSEESHALVALLCEPVLATALRDRVGSAFSDGTSGPDPLSCAMLAPMARLGMILVPPTAGDALAGGGDDALAAAREQGRRVAEVTGWVTHAKSHHHHH